MARKELVSWKRQWRWRKWNGRIYRKWYHVTVELGGKSQTGMYGTLGDGKGGHSEGKGCVQRRE